VRPGPRTPGGMRVPDPRLNVSRSLSRFGRAMYSRGLVVTRRSKSASTSVPIFLEGPATAGPPFRAAGRQPLQRSRVGRAGAGWRAELCDLSCVVSERSRTPAPPYAHTRQPKRLDPVQENHVAPLQGANSLLSGISSRRFSPGYDPASSRVRGTTQDKCCRPFRQGRTCLWHGGRRLSLPNGEPHRSPGLTPGKE
jgi:hypothetical protein